MNSGSSHGLMKVRVRNKSQLVHSHQEALIREQGKILPWEIQELLEGSTNERSLFLYINYVFLLQTASIN